MPVLALSARVDAILADGHANRERIEHLERVTADGATRLDAALDRVTEVLARIEGGMRAVAREEVAISEARQWESKLASHLAVLTDEIADLKRWCTKWGKRGLVLLLGATATGLGGLFSAKLVELVRHLVPWLAS